MAGKGMWDGEQWGRVPSPAPGNPHPVHSDTVSSCWDRGRGAEDITVTRLLLPIPGEAGSLPGVGKG